MNFPIGNQYITPQSALEQVIKSRLVPGVSISLWSRGADEPSGINNAVPQKEAMERMNSWRLIQNQILSFFFFFGLCLLALKTDEQANLSGGIWKMGSAGSQVNVFSLCDRTVAALVNQPGADGS